MVILIAFAIAIVLVALIAADFSSTYNVEPAAVVLFLLPLLVTVPALAASVKWLRKTGTVPPGFDILALSVVAIVIVPMMEMLLASTLGLL